MRLIALKPAYAERNWRDFPLFPRSGLGQPQCSNACFGKKCDVRGTLAACGRMRDVRGKEIITMLHGSMSGPAVLLSALLVAATALPAAAEPARPAGQCFNTTEMGNWRAVDASTLYVRVRTNKVYRLDLKGRCSMLMAPGAMLITTFRGSDLICSPLDWDLKVSAGIGSNVEPCIVKTMTPLSADEIVALPKKVTP